MIEAPMKITLISPYPDITAFGLRTISAYLRANGIRTRLVFMPDPMGDHLAPGQAHYDAGALSDLAVLCEDSDLIGISLMTNYFDAAVQITSGMTGSGIPVIWGGVHPTIRPEESLEHADMVVIGEGETALLTLLKRMEQGEDYTDTPGIWLKKDGRMIQNDPGPLPMDLDLFPPPDYSLDDHYILEGGRIVPLTHGISKRYLEQGTVSEYVGRIGYQTMTSRGCPYACAYCINSFMNRMYGRRGKLRWRSIDLVMAELRHVKETMPYVNYIWISDDEFMARKMADLRYFAERYKSEIGFPFSCLVSPLSVTDEKMALLIDAGLVYVQMGVESGSKRMQKIYNRPKMNNRRMMAAIETIHRYQADMHPPSYDFLIDAPYETLEDKIESLRFISRIPKPYRLQPFALILYPGTQLYTMAKQDGLIIDEDQDIYNKSYIMREQTYINLMITLARKGNVPTPLLRIASHPRIAGFLSLHAFKPMMRLAYSGLRAVYEMKKRLVRNG